MNEGIKPHIVHEPTHIKRNKNKQENSSNGIDRPQKDVLDVHTIIYI